MRHVKEAPPSALERVRAANATRKLAMKRAIAEAANRREEARLRLIAVLALFKAVRRQRRLFALAPCMVPLEDPGGPDRTWLWLALALAWPLLLAVFVL